MANITELDIVIRLCLGFLAGGIIGFERSSRRQVAGLRTHILIALGATCLTLLSIWIPQNYFDMKNGDPGRIAAQVVSGIGFLGAGAIIRLGNDVKGLTTAASLWLVAAIGMAIGAGMYIAALTGEILALITLITLNRVERKIFPDIKKRMLEVVYTHRAEPNTEAVLDIFKKFNVKTKTANVHLGNFTGKKTRVIFLVSSLDTVDISKVANTIKACDDVDRIEIKEKY
ncbi:MAG: MgtC/SapB family protein [Treponema sp.]|jgi:putative Mg2+ transporter-C (MgtC) family protein|nr:MgtC/SapB family protein [Treponema sp.]